MYGFFLIEAYLSIKNVWLPLIFFLDSNSPCQDVLFPYSQKPRKNTFELVGTVIMKPEIFGQSGDAQSECAEKKEASF